MESEEANHVGRALNLGDHSGEVGKIRSVGHLETTITVDDGEELGAHFVLGENEDSHSCLGICERYLHLSAISLLMSVFPLAQRSLCLVGKLSPFFIDK